MGYVDVCDLSFDYGQEQVLYDLNFRINRGMMVGVLGPNGCGKTTLLKNLCRLLKPRRGKVLLEGNDLGAMAHRDLAKQMGVVSQGVFGAFDFSVYDVVLMGRYAYQSSFRGESTTDLKIARRAMEHTQTWHLREKNITQISGGERQRVIIARALAQEPQILLLDEPISQLDIKHQINILDLCRELNRTQKITVVMTLHDLNLAGRYADRIMLLDQGRIVAWDVPEKVLTRQNISRVYGVEVKLLYGEGPVPYIVPETVQEGYPWEA
ncbi:MAG: ABC transporter ATP-binding protein [Limnochordia bacterium]|nr:ABC transporter ATP-binding protein [Limnochordia bacterium]